MKRKIICGTFPIKLSYSKRKSAPIVRLYARLRGSSFAQANVRSTTWA